MTDFSFPEKPNYNFTKEQMLERKKVLKNIKKLCLHQEEKG